MKISNPNGLPTIDYRTVKPLQGNLKDLTQANYDKLKKVLNKRGFEVPLFLWANGDNYYLMDGHQRQRVMVGEDMHDDNNYDVPYILIEAANEQNAKAKLLEITSQYGTITQEGFDEFIVDLPEVEIYELTHFDALKWGLTLDDSKPDELELTETKELAVSLEKESDLQALFEELTERGYKCRILTL